MAVLRLADGRRIGIAEYGDPHGFPVLWCHGTPSSRLLPPPDLEATRARGIRYVVVERPGYGLSDAKRDRSILDFADDVVEITAQLGIDRFAVGAWSGGGPYAAACAHRLPDRVARLVVVGSVAPIDAPGAWDDVALRGRAVFALAARSPALLRAAMRASCFTGARVFRFMTRHLDECDRRVLSDATIFARHVASAEEAFRQGPDAFVHDLHLLTKPWNFPLESIRVPTTSIWGARDRTTPLSMAHAWSAIPGSHLRVIEDEGHFVPYRHASTILDALLGAGAGLRDNR
jgi:pimeloyl-ACP methyl ester carboxylesterase